jgi:D-arabinitol 4-dehydrogenase
MPVILHLGLSSFHRAHQAAYLQRLIDAGDRSWTLAAGNLRPDMAETIAALRAQGGAYTLETVAPDGQRCYETITAIQKIVPYEPGWANLVALGADPDTRIVSFTVTEAGYERDGDIYAALAAILRERQRRNAGPLTLLNCDNLRHNGERVAARLLDFLQRAGDAALCEWVRAHTSCPNAMVDRITPRPTAEVRERVRQATGRDDAAPLMAESFMQWVIEDDFRNGRPAWERVGVQMVESVAPYEEAKIRILNGTHSCFAWAGTLAGMHYIHEGVRDERIRRLAYDYVTDDVIPCLRPSPIDLERYRDVVLERFGNAALRDTNQRVAMDAFSKIPGFIAPTVRDRLARGEPIDSVAMLPALFLVFLQRWHLGALPASYEDQAMDPAVAHAICASADPVAALCRNTTLWAELACDERLTAALRTASARVNDLFLKECSV